MEKNEMTFQEVLAKFGQPLEDYKTEEVFDFLVAENDDCEKLFLSKDLHYQGSWQKNGAISGFLNVKRKFDRLEAAFNSGSLFSPDGMGEETINDTLKDLAVYSNLLNYFLTKKKEENERKEN